MTTALPVAAASRIVQDSGHLILLAVAVLAGIGYLLYRRNRDKRDRDEEGR
jgi:hypothetical protein